MTTVVFEKGILAADSRKSVLPSRAHDSSFCFGTDMPYEGYYDDNIVKIFSLKEVKGVDGNAPVAIAFAGDVNVGSSIVKGFMLGADFEATLGVIALAADRTATAILMFEKDVWKIKIANGKAEIDICRTHDVQIFLGSGSDAARMAMIAKPDMHPVDAIICASKADKHTGGFIRYVDVSIDKDVRTSGNRCASYSIEEILRPAEKPTKKRGKK